MNLDQLLGGFGKGGKGDAEDHEKLRAEIAQYNQHMLKIREEDLGYMRVLADPKSSDGEREEASNALTTNNLAVIASREEVVARAGKLGISGDEALHIGVDKPVH